MPLFTYLLLVLSYVPLAVSWALRAALWPCVFLYKWWWQKPKKGEEPLKATTKNGKEELNAPPADSPQDSKPACVEGALQGQEATQTNEGKGEDVPPAVGASASSGSLRRRAVPPRAAAEGLHQQIPSHIIVDSSFSIEALEELLPGIQWQDPSEYFSRSESSESQGLTQIIIVERSRPGSSQVPAGSSREEEAPTTHAPPQGEH